MSQEDFSRRTGLSLATVRGIENERRALTQATLFKLSISLLAHWDDAAQEWRPLWDKTRVYAKADAETAAWLHPQEGDTRSLMTRMLEERLHAICYTISPDRFMGEVMRLNAMLADYARETGLKVDLASTEPHWTLAEEGESVAGGTIRRILQPEYLNAKVQKSTPRTKNNRTQPGPKRVKGKKSADK